MGTVNVCVRRSYVAVASVIAIVSGLLLALTLFSHGHFHEDEKIDMVLPGLKLMYAISIITILLVVTGLYGVCKQKKWMLICYAVTMCLSCLLLSALNIKGLAERPKTAEGLRQQYLRLMPLTNASENVLEHMDEIQTELQCCGLDQGYQDWGYNISEACVCVVAAPRNSSLYQIIKTNDNIMIYKEPCVYYLVSYVLMVIDGMLGVMFGMLLLRILSVVLCVVILCQLNRKEDIPTVVYSAEAKAGNYDVLANDAELT